MLLNFFFVPPTGTLTIASPENAFALAVFLVTGVAVASVVDRAALFPPFQRLGDVPDGDGLTMVVDLPAAGPTTGTTAPA